MTTRFLSDKSLELEASTLTLRADCGLVVALWWAHQDSNLKHRIMSPRPTFTNQTVRLGGFLTGVRGTPVAGLQLVQFLLPFQSSEMAAFLPPYSYHESDLGYATVDH